MSRVAVLIPCFNEAETIRKVIIGYRSALPEADIYVYDNNSTDGTAEKAREAGAVVRHEYRQGKGNVIRSMFRDIDADCYLVTDGDDTYPADNAPEMVRLILEGKADMVSADRLSSTYFEENKRPFHNSGNRIVRGLVNLLFGTKIHDAMTGCRTFSRAFAKTFPVLSEGFEIETEMTAYAVTHNFVIREIPVEYRDRPKGSFSKLHTCADGFRVLRTVFRMVRDFRPLLFFGFFSLLLLAAAAACTIPVLPEYFSAGVSARFPALIAGAACVVCALLCFFSGVILNVSLKQQKRITELIRTLSREIRHHGTEE